MAWRLVESEPRPLVLAVFEAASFDRTPLCVSALDFPFGPVDKHAVAEEFLLRAQSFLRKMAKKVISFLTLSKCGIISNFGVNLFGMSASSEREPHPSCPQARSGQLTATPASEFRGAGAGGLLK